MIEKIKYLYRAYRYKYKIDPAEINYIYNKVNINDTVIDIGAHKGGYLFWMQKKVGKNGKVFAFEPQPKLYQYLSKIIKINNFSNVQLEHKGVSSEEGELTLNIPISKSGTSPGATIEKINNAENFKQVKVKVVKLDTFLDKHVSPSLIKIDVEGHEKAVLEGSLEVLKRSHPTIVMECEQRHLTGHSVFDVFQILLNLGYKGYFFKQRKLLPLDQFDLNIHQKQVGDRFWENDDYSNNFVFEWS